MYATDSTLGRNVSNLKPEMSTFGERVDRVDICRWELRTSQLAKLKPSQAQRLESARSQLGELDGLPRALREPLAKELIDQFASGPMKPTARPKKRWAPENGGMRSPTVRSAE